MNITGLWAREIGITEDKDNSKINKQDMGIYNYLISIANLVEMERITFVAF